MDAHSHSNKQTNKQTHTNDETELEERELNKKVSCISSKCALVWGLLPADNEASNEVAGFFTVTVFNRPCLRYSLADILTILTIAQNCPTCRTAARDARKDGPEESKSHVLGEKFPHPSAGGLPENSESRGLL